MKRFKKTLIACLLVAALWCVGLTGMAAFAEEGATPVIDGYFNGINLRANAAITGYVTLECSFEHDLTDKMLAVRIHKRAGGAGLDWKMDGKAIAESGTTMYYVDVGNKNVNSDQKYSWSMNELPVGFNGWSIIETTATSGNHTLRFGLVDSSKQPDYDFGTVKAIDIPEGKTYADFTAALENGTTLYEFATADALNSYYFHPGTGHDLTVSRVKETAAYPLYYGEEIEGDFDGMNLKFDAAITDPIYSTLTSASFEADLTGKYLAFRYRDKRPSGAGVSQVQPRITDVAYSGKARVGFVDMDAKKCWGPGGKIGWCVEFNPGFNGWVVMEASAMEGTMSGMKTFGFGMGSWSGCMDVDLGKVVLFDNKPSADDGEYFNTMEADTEAGYDTMMAAIEDATVLYDFANPEGGLRNDYDLNNFRYPTTFSPVKAPVEPDVPVGPELGDPVDAYFDGLHLEFEGMTAYRWLTTAAFETGNYIAIEYADRTDGSNYVLDMKFDHNNVTGGQMYLLNTGRGRLSASVSNWSVPVEPNFLGWIVFDSESFDFDMPASAELQIGFHSDWSGNPKLDLGRIVTFDTLEDTTYEAIAAAIEDGTTVYSFAGTEAGTVNVDTDFKFGDEATLARANKTLTNADLPAERVPDYCEIVGDTKVMNFGLKEGEDINSFVNNAGGYPECLFSAVQRADDGLGSDRTALHVKLGASNETAPHSAIEVSPKGYGATVETDAKGLTFYIKNYGKAFHISIGFDLGGARWITKWSSNYAVYRLYDIVNGTECTRNGSYDGLYIPENFEGYVRVGFEQFELAEWSRPLGIEWDDVKGGTVTYMSIDVNTDKYAGHEFDIDSIGWYYGDVRSANGFLNFSTKPTIAEAMANDKFFATEEE